MKTVEDVTPVNAQETSDQDAVLQHLMAGTPVPGDVARRVEERANGIRERVRRAQGEVDIERLLHDARDES